MENKTINNSVYGKTNEDFIFIAFVDGLVKGEYGKGTMLASANKSTIVPTSLIRTSKEGKRYLKAHKDMVFTIRTTAFNEETRKYEETSREVMTSLQLRKEMEGWKPEATDF